MILPTPDKNGVGNGQAAVVKDLPVNPNQNDAENTVQPEGNQPQPGHDVFAQEPVKEYESQAAKEESTFTEDKIMDDISSPEFDGIGVDPVVPVDKNPSIIDPPRAGDQADEVEAEIARNDLFGGEYS